MEAEDNMIRIKAKCDDDCEECTPKIIASYTTNIDNPVWDLTPYQGSGIGEPNRYWRLFERSGGVVYDAGEIDENGTLVGLPDEFRSGYYYDGYMELQQGCSNYCCTDLSFCWDDVLWP